MDVNARGLFFAMRAEIRAMAGTGGAIVNVGSVGSFTGLVGQAIYAASKHAVWALTRSAAVENARSEEHTSELQSLMRISYAVFCLKKKNKYNNTHCLNMD